MTPLMEKSIFSMVEDEVLSLSSLSLGSFLDPQLSCRPKEERAKGGGGGGGGTSGTSIIARGCELRGGGGV